MKFTEFTYLEQTNYTVTCYYEALNRIHNGYTDKQMYEEFTLYDDTP